MQKINPEITVPMPSPYTFFRPLLAADRSWTAFDWQSSAAFAGDANDVVRSFTESAAIPLADHQPLVVPVNPASLEQDAFVDSLGAGRVVFVLPSTSLENTRTLDRCRFLHGKGYRLAVQINDASLVRQVPLGTFSFLWLDAAFARHDLSTLDIAYIRDAGFKTITTNVGSHEMFGWLHDRAFDWYDSHFLVTRNPNSGREPDLTRLKLLKLLNIVKHDGDTHDIEAIFREEPKLSYNLLRLVNSVAVGARTKISSFSQAIAILGRRQLQRWLQLLIYANNLADGNAPNPLMQMAAARGRQMELLVATIEPQPNIADLTDNAFMTGLFSLLDILIELPMREILKELPMQDEVVSALTPPDHNGVLGQLLSAVIAGESGQFSSAEAILADLNISPATHAAAQVSALYWATRINIDHHD